MTAFYWIYRGLFPGGDVDDLLHITTHISSSLLCLALHVTLISIFELYICIHPSPPTFDFNFSVVFFSFPFFLRRFCCCNNFFGIEMMNWITLLDCLPSLPRLASPLRFCFVWPGDLEKSLAECIVDSELETECKVVRRLKLILDKEIQEISTMKRNVSRTLQEYASLTRSYEVSSNHNQLKEPHFLK